MSKATTFPLTIKQGRKTFVLVEHDCGSRFYRNAKLADKAERCGICCEVGPMKLVKK